MNLTVSHAPALTPRKQARDRKRRSIFRALVAAQDAGMGVAQSRLAVAEEFRITVEYLKSVEREGINAGWLDG